MKLFGGEVGYYVVWFPYIFWILTHYQTLYLQIFYLIQQVSCSIFGLFCVLCGAFKFGVAPLLIFAFVVFALGVKSKKHQQKKKLIAKINVKDLIDYFYSRSFIISVLITF